MINHNSWKKTVKNHHSCVLKKTTMIKISTLVALWCYFWT